MFFFSFNLKDFHSNFFFPLGGSRVNLMKNSTSISPSRCQQKTNIDFCTVMYIFSVESKSMGSFYMKQLFDIWEASLLYSSS